MLSTGENNTNIVDMNLNAKANEVTLTFTGRLLSSDGYNFADRNPSIAGNLYTDPSKWGPFINTEFAGYGSKRFDYYLQGDLSYKGLTLGMIHWFYESGYSSEWAATKALNKAIWQFQEECFYSRYEKDIASNLNSKTLFKFRVSSAPPTASFIERYAGGVDFSYWPVINRSVSLFQDFSYTINERLFVNFGAKYEHKLLQKAYPVT